MYKHLFFDLDHTLWDFERNATDSLHDLYHQLNLQTQGITDFNQFLNNYLAHNSYWWAQYHQNKITAAQLKWQRMYSTITDFGINNIDLAHTMSDTFLDILPEKQAVFEDCYTVLDYLKNKNYKLHLITNGFEITQWRKLRASKLDQYFEQVITSEASGHIKPQKQIFDYALQIALATKDESIMLGDNIEADIEGAHNAGWHTVFVNHINATPPPQATHTVTQLAQLMDLF